MSTMRTAGQPGRPPRGSSRTRPRPTAAKSLSEGKGERQKAPAPSIRARASATSRTWIGSPSKPGSALCPSLGSSTTQSIPSRANGNSTARPGAHHHVGRSLARGLVDRRPVPFEAAVVRRDGGAGGQRPSQVVASGARPVSISGTSTKRLLSPLDRAARQRRDRFGHLRGGHPPHEGAAAPHGGLPRGAEGARFAVALGGEDRDGFRASSPAVTAPRRTSPRKGAPRNAGLGQQGGGRAFAAVLHRDLQEPALAGSAAQVRGGALLTTAHSTARRSGAEGESTILPCDSASRRPSTPRSRFRRMRRDDVPALAGPAGRGSVHRVAPRVQARREGGAQHHGQRHGGGLGDPGAELDQICGDARDPWRRPARPRGVGVACRRRRSLSRA